jgi:hypothetical protein
MIVQPLSYQLGTEKTLKIVSVLLSNRLMNELLFKASQSESERESESESESVS